MSKRKIRIEVFKGGGEQRWFWHIRWSNGRIAATSEGYAQHGTATVLAQKMAVLLGVPLVQR